jgi:threonyl-tRNA synthetase
VLGEVLELTFGCDLTIGPSLEEGFYYDCFLGERTLAEEDCRLVEKAMEKAVKVRGGSCALTRCLCSALLSFWLQEKQTFERVEVSRDEALAMFQENKFKVEIIQALPAEARITLYRVGPMVDLCRGPHVPHTGILKAVAVTSASRAFWRADVKSDPLQRVYAITFPDAKQLKEYKTRIEEAKKRDHRVVGPHQELFFFHPLSPGSCFFQPHGARVYNALVDLIKEKYWEYEYQEVITPNIFNFELWKTSGHAAHYKDAMFSFAVEKEEFGMKPMNCPGHCLMFRERVRSYRELPLRLADFGVLHRNELSGALSGLTRVRRFQQDDAHIFCRAEQIQEEVLAFLRLMDSVYQTFGLSYEANLSTRPEGFLGEIQLWDKAEAALSSALDAFGKPWALNPGDGAFYGPKIDITVFDALKRKFQCATVQLDFQLPIRFNLQYVTDKPGAGAAGTSEDPAPAAAAVQGESGLENGSRQRPVIIHRACLGSVERMLGILTEHYAGKWPLWLSPRQVMVVPVGSAFVPFAAEVRARLRREHMHVDVDASDRKMQKKVREAQLEQYNYILVVGAEEVQSRTVNVRSRDNVVHGALPLEEVAQLLAQECRERTMDSAFHGIVGANADEHASTTAHAASPADA